jgi:uncharacterized membrane protein YeaQ/YmgE (transglycosylase-associated protein family)
MIPLQHLAKIIQENGVGGVIGAVVGAIVALQFASAGDGCEGQLIPQPTAHEILYKCLLPNGTTYFVEGPNTFPMLIIGGVVGAILGGFAWRAYMESKR